LGRVYAKRGPSQAGEANLIADYVLVWLKKSPAVETVGLKYVDEESI